MKMQIGTVMFSLVTTLTACSGDRAKVEDTRINAIPQSPPQPAPVAGFGSGTPVAEKPAPVIVDEKPKAEPKAKSDLDVTRERLLAAAKLDKKSATPHVELARSYIATGDRALAIRHAQKAVKLAPKSSQAQNTLGRAELLRHDYPAAILAFREATMLDADNVWAWNNLGLVYLTQKDYKEAVSALIEATRRKGSEGYMWNNLGLAYEQLDQLDEAREAFESGAKLGSVAAKASRKRLEGVDTVAVAKKVEKKGEKAIEKTDSGFEAREPMPELVDEPSPEDPDVIDQLEIGHGDDVEAPVEAPVEAKPIEEKPAPTTL